MWGERFILAYRRPSGIHEPRQKRPFPLVFERVTETMLWVTSAMVWALMVALVVIAVARIFLQP